MTILRKGTATLAVKITSASGQSPCFRKYSTPLKIVSACSLPSASVRVIGRTLAGT